MLTVKRLRYTDEFKKQIVELVSNGKSPLEISKEYIIARSTGSFKAKGKRNIINSYN